MVKWEYGQVVPERGGVGWRGSMDAPRPSHGQPIIDYLNRLGADGWELVAMFPGEPHPIYTLKRPIADPR